MANVIRVLSGGAAQALVGQLRERFAAETGCAIEASFGAVGAMKDKLLAGEACDVLILTESLITQLTTEAQVVAGSARPLGVVKTGIALKDGAAPVAVDSPQALKAALLAASGVYFPDPHKATAGIHFMKVLRSLGLEEALAGRLHPFPNGAAAMGEMARAPGDQVIGCTQVTEILFAPGVQLVGLLPKEFELATVYTAAVCSRAANPGPAAALVALLAGTNAAAIRAEVGFEPG